MLGDTMLARKIKERPDALSRIIPERMVVLNEIVVLLVLRRSGDWCTVFELEVGVAKMRGDPSRSIQLTGGLKQLLGQGLIETESFQDTRARRPVAKYKLTPKGETAADLFLELFKTMST